jgi:hypothetical protein
MCQQWFELMSSCGDGLDIWLINIPHDAIPCVTWLAGLARMNSLLATMYSLMRTYGSLAFSIGIARVGL